MHILLCRALKPLLPALAQLILEENHILRVALVRSICNVANERDDTDDEVNNDVELHSHLDRSVQLRFNGGYCPVHHQAEKHIEDIADTRNYSNDSTPAALDAQKAAEGEVEAISPAFGLGQDLRLFLR